MKKTIFIMLLAILMVTSVFADTAKDTQTTEVILTLERDPTYKVAITTTALGTDTTTVSKDTTLTHVGTITLDYFKETLKFAQKSSDTFYLSFLFYDYADVTLGMKIDGPLTRYESEAAQTGTYNQIDYIVSVETAKDNKNVDINAFELTSSGTKEKSEVVKYDDTKKMGEIRYASLKLTVGPTSEDQTVEGKIVGTYKSTITITATTTA